MLSEPMKEMLTEEVDRTFMLGVTTENNRIQQLLVDILTHQSESLKNISGNMALRVFLASMKLEEKED